MDRLARLQEVTVALSGSLTPAQVAEVIVAQGVGALGASAGVVALITADGAALCPLRAEGYTEEVLEPWRCIPLPTQVPLTDAVRLRKPILVESLADLQNRYPVMIDTAKIADGTTSSWAAIPLITQKTVLGALGLTFPAAQRFSVDDTAFLLSLARQCAQALERAQLYENAQRAREAAERDRKRLTFLAEASAAFAASLDYRTTLANVARLAVSQFADWCAVDMLTEESDKIERLAVSHRDPARVAWAAELLRKYPLDRNAPSGTGRVIRTGALEFLPEVTDALLVAGTRSEEQLADARAIGLISYLCVPLTARGRILGAITLATTADSGRHFTESDVSLAQELAARAALAVDNSRLYEEARQERAAAEDILESITDAFYAIDSAWHFTYVNQRAEAYLGHSRDSLLGSSLWDILPAGRGSVFEKHYRRAMNEQAPVDFEALSPHSNRWLEVRAYPSSNGLSVYFRDVTERHEAEEERRTAARARQTFVKDLLASVTEGRLQLCSLPEDLPSPLAVLGAPLSLTPTALRRLRQTVHLALDDLAFPTERIQDLVTAASEAAMNAIQHAGGGTARVCALSDMMQVWIEDQGTGIAMERLPRATLEAGYSEAGSLGHGFWLMLQTADRVWLLTGPSGTTVVLEQGRSARLTPAWLTAR